MATTKTGRIWIPKSADKSLSTILANEEKVKILEERIQQKSTSKSDDNLHYYIESFDEKADSFAGKKTFNLRNQGMSLVYTKN